MFGSNSELGQESASLERVRSGNDMTILEALIKTVETVLQSRLNPRGLRPLGVSEGHKVRVRPV